MSNEFDPLAEDLAAIERFEVARAAHALSINSGSYSQATALASFEATSALYERMTQRFPAVVRELARLREIGTMNGEHL